jgi:hypothetical protein
MKLKVEEVDLGLTPELTPQETPKTLGSGLTVIPLTLAHKPHRQELKTPWFLRVSKDPPAKEPAWLCAGALLGVGVLASSPSPTPEVPWQVHFLYRPQLPIYFIRTGSEPGMVAHTCNPSYLGG